MSFIFNEKMLLELAEAISERSSAMQKSVKRLNKSWSRKSGLNCKTKGIASR